jgi:hypothetical protein
VKNSAAKKLQNSILQDNVIKLDSALDKEPSLAVLSIHYRNLTSFWPKPTIKSSMEELIKLGLGRSHKEEKILPQMHGWLMYGPYSINALYELLFTEVK